MCLNPTGELTTAQLKVMAEMRDHIDAVLDAHGGDLPWWATAAKLDRDGAIDVATSDLRAAIIELTQLDTEAGIVARAAQTPVYELSADRVAALLGREAQR